MITKSNWPVNNWLQQELHATEELDDNEKNIQVQKIRKNIDDYLTPLIRKDNVYVLEINLLSDDKHKLDFLLVVDLWIFNSEVFKKIQKFRSVKDEPLLGFSLRGGELNMAVEIRPHPPTPPAPLVIDTAFNIFSPQLTFNTSLTIGEGSMSVAQVAKAS
jgi:hypothetical protein